ncbi:MAG: tail fiber protein, partial [Gammaproteobacteria bacterium]|nr:tail fiber protein [Gammaproteobacteria bacterium]
MTAADKAKLDAVENGAQVNVKSDWIASSGDAEILNKPIIPAAQVNSDWTATSGVEEILNKPAIPADQVNSDWDATSGVEEILNKPAIPAAQVNSDWDAVGGVEEILNKPAILPEAPNDGQQYARQSEAWAVVSGAGGGGVTQIVAGTNVTVDPVGGTGIVTVNSTGGGGAGVSSIIAGTGIAVDQATGDVTITNTGVCASATIGAIVAWANSTVPTGWLECDGSPIPAQYTELIALVGSNTPDLRGEFVRGWDNGAGVDTGRALLSNQADEFKSHTHQFSSYTGGGGNLGGTDGSAFNGKAGTDGRGGSETRPRNVALMYIINADGSSIGPGGGGGGTPVPQKVALLADVKPSGTAGGTAVAGWQDRTLNTKLSDNYNLVTLANDKEFTLTAGTYLIEWSAPAFQVKNFQTKLTNVTSGTLVEYGSSEYILGSLNVVTRSFGSARVNISSNTTYKIEHYCDGGKASQGLGISSKAASGADSVFTQVSITDLSIVGGTGTAANTN